MTMKYFIRKLASLDYPSVNDFDVNDHEQFRFVISWLENRFIRHYTEEERTGLNNTKSSEWNLNYDKYLTDLKCPCKSKDPNESLDWLLCLAVQLYYASNDKDKKFSEMTGEKFNIISQLTSLATLNQIDTNTDEFKANVYHLASVLDIPHHPDHIRVLKACSHLIVEKLSKENVDKAKAMDSKTKLNYMNVDEIAHGINETNDFELKRMTAILRLIHMRNLRQLQMDINSVMVCVQEMVANPQTNEKLGKIGF